MHYSYAESDELTLLRQTIRSFAEKEIAPKARELDEHEEFSYDLTAKMGELGLFGMVVPQEYGGQGMDYLSYVVAVEELARIDGSQAATIAAHNSLGVTPIYYYGSEEQKHQYIPSLCDGHGLWAFGLTEPDVGSAASMGLKTTCKRNGDTWTINGQKKWIGNATFADYIIIWAKDEDDHQVKGFIIDRETPGMTTEKIQDKMSLRTVQNALITIKDCKIKEFAF